MTHRDLTPNEPQERELTAEELAELRAELARELIAPDGEIVGLFERPIWNEG